ncbi:MAG TPA: diguanylate cyclase, partial [Candidatus Izemoplasmatales bacterium]|nr:diguanylate cyclase [Candidatus Izemoplasmatales bacterium]
MPNTFPNIMIPEPRTIENHLYLLDRPDDTGPMMPTPTVLVDGSEMVLFGVGEHSDFQRLVHQLQSILPLDHLRYVVAPGMERQLVSTMTAFRDAGANPTFVVDEKLDRLMNLSAQGMPLKLVAKEDESLILATGRILRFIPTPFIITSMSFATFDATSGLLFSHYLFDLAEARSASHELAERIRQTKDFCLNYVPSSDFLRPALQKIAEANPRLAITQSGWVLDREAISAYAEALSKIEFFNQNLGFTRREENGGLPDYQAACHQILQKWKSIHGLEALHEAIPEPIFPVDWESLEVQSPMTGPKVLDDLLDTVRRTRGIGWLLAVEPLIVQLRTLSGIEIPTVFRSILGESERRLETIGMEKTILESQVATLEKSLRLTLEKMTKDPLTGYYNEVFLRQHLEERLRIFSSGSEEPNIQLYFIQIDNIQAINAKYTAKIGDETIRNLGYLLEEIIRPQDLLVKRNGPGYIVLVMDGSDRIPASFARTIQNAAKNSESFLEPITLSVAVVRSKEFIAASESLAEKMIAVGESRTKSAVRKVGAFVDETTPIEKNKYGRLLVADGEAINLRLLESLFFNENFEVKTAKDGLAAWEMAKDAPFDAIIVDRTIPKMDGMLLKQNLNQSTPNANTP